MSRMKRNGMRVTVLGLSLAVAIAIFEIALRLLSPSNVLSPNLPLKPFVRMELRPNLPGVSPGGLFTTNSLGLRGSEPPRQDSDVIRVVAVGGSTTQCFYLDDHKTWPWLVQELAGGEEKIWVGNGGIDGHSTRGHLIFFEDALPELRPDAAIVLCGINDLGLSLSHQRRQQGGQYDHTSLSYRLYARSRLLQILFLWKKILWDKAHVVAADGHEAYVPIPLTVPEAPVSDREITAALPQLAEYRENLRRLIALGRRLGTRMIFMTQPMLYENSETWRAIQAESYWTEADRPWSAATQRRMLDRYNQELIDVCREERIDVIDLASEMPSSTEFFYDCVHFTEAGARRVAEITAPRLRALLSTTSKTQP